MSAPIAHRAQYALYRWLAWCVRRMSDPSAARLGAFLGAAVHALAHVRRRVARENIARAFGAPGSVGVRAVFRAGGRLFVECLRLPRYRGRCASLVRVDGAPHLDDALQAGRGAIIFTGHLGNWELIGPALVERGIPVTLLVGRQHNARVDEWLNAHRRALGVGVVPLEGGMREALRLLRRRQVVGLLVDQHVHRGGVVVPYFGRPAATSPAAARIARSSGAPLVPLAIVREDDGVHHVLRVGASFTVDRADDAVEVTARITRAVEEMVRQSPSQYFWFHRRWKLDEAGGLRGVEEREAEQPRRVLQGAGDLTARP